MAYTKSHGNLKSNNIVLEKRNNLKLNFNPLSLSRFWFYIMVLKTKTKCGLSKSGEKICVANKKMSKHIVNWILRNYLKTCVSQESQQFCFENPISIIIGQKYFASYLKRNILYTDIQVRLFGTFKKFDYVQMD